MDASHLGRIAKSVSCPPLSVFRLFTSLRIEYYDLGMNFLIMLLVRALEGMFVVGLVGSLGVLLVSFVEDIETLFDMEDDPSRS